MFEFQIFYKLTPRRLLVSESLGVKNQLILNR